MPSIHTRQPARHRTALAAAAALLGLVGVIVGTLVVAPAARADTVSYSGSFSDDDERFSLGFSFVAAQTLVARTFSYGGGVNGDAQVIGAGGFAPVLSLFDATGLLLQIASGSAADCLSGVGAVDPASGFCWDVGLSAALAAGDYTLVLTQDANLPFGPSLADGFSMTGSPDYTGLAYLGLPDLRFINVDGSQRDGHWALDVNATAIPVPSSVALLAAGFLAFGATVRRCRPV